MRLVLFLVGVFILGNLVFFLLPKSGEALSEKYIHKEEVAPDTINLVAQRTNVNRFGFSSEKKMDKQIAAIALGGSNLNDSMQGGSIQNSSEQSGIKQAQGGSRQDSSKQSGFARSKIRQGVKNKCYRVGPFMHFSRLSLAKAKLNNLNMNYDVEKRESNSAEVFRIYLGPYATHSEAVDARQQLTEKGVFDHFQRKEDDQHIVSLGIYSRSVLAQRSLETFIDQGIDVRMRPERTVLPISYWLNVAEVSENFSMNSMRGVDWGEHSAQFGAYSC